MIGYARVSSGEQRLDLQVRALTHFGCRVVFQDHGETGRHLSRDGLKSALNTLQAGDTLVVWRLDRLGRSLSGLIEVIDELGNKRIHFKSIMENIDTTSSGGKLVFHMMAALAEFERTLISERTRAGLVEARLRGKVLGRPKIVSDQQILYAINEIKYRRAKLVNVADNLGISVRTLQRYLGKNKSLF